MKTYYGRYFLNEGDGKLRENFPTIYNDPFLFYREIETGNTYTLIRDVQGLDVTSTLYVSGSTSPVDVTVDMVRLNQSNATLFKFTEYIDTIIAEPSPNDQSVDIGFNQLIRNNTAESFSVQAYNKGELGIVNTNYDDTINYKNNSIPQIDSNPITVTFSAGTESNGVRAIQIRGRLI